MFKYSISFFRLIRFRVSLGVTFAAFTAAIVANSSLNLEMIIPMMGIFLLSAGASSLNQYQERKEDGVMQRTRNRPIPSRQIAERRALIISLCLLIIGFVMLFIHRYLTGLGTVTIALGLFNIFWYNGFYTWMKKKTAFAVFPGALTGSMVVLMGWTSMGGYLFAPPGLLLGFFIFLWQMPHFWLLMLIHQKDYEVAGLPSLPALFSQTQMKRIILGWILALCLTALSFLLFGFVRYIFSAIVLTVVVLVLFTFFIQDFFISKTSNSRFLFLSINLFMVIILFLLLTEQIIHL